MSLDLRADKTLQESAAGTERPLDRPISWLAPGAVQPSLRAEGAGKILTDGSRNIQVPLLPW